METTTKILIVEDELPVRDLCQTFLHNNGFESLVATNGEEGLAVYHKEQREIALVLSDVEMPVKNGIEMAREIFSTSPHPRIILMSGNFPEIPSEEMNRLCSLIAKPFTSTQLIKAVKDCL
jgi:DNA-binding NtrC family response regulator